MAPEFKQSLLNDVTSYFRSLHNRTQEDSSGPKKTLENPIGSADTWHIWPVVHIISGSELIPSFFRFKSTFLWVVVRYQCYWLQPIQSMNLSSVEFQSKSDLNGEGTSDITQTETMITSWKKTERRIAGLDSSYIISSFFRYLNEIFKTSHSITHEMWH